MSKTTYPPKTRITRPTDAEIRKALRIVKKHVIDWWNPWPDSVSDNTIRWLRREKYIVATKCSGGLQMAQGVFGHSWVEDALTDKGRAFLATAAGNHCLTLLRQPVARCRSGD